MFEFVIVGAQKCATTSLYEYLRQCESIAVPEIKEIPYFTDDKIYGDKDKFDFYFDKDYMKSSKVKGFAYVNISYYYEKINRLLEINPDVKLIFVVRNRADRAYSAYKYALTRGWECEKCVKLALDIKREASFKNYWEYSNLTYISHSLYGEQIEGILEYIPKENLLLVDFEKLKSDPGNVLQETLKFIGGEEEDSKNVEFKIYNKESGVRSSQFQRLIMLDNSIKKIYQFLFPSRLRSFINKRIVRKVEEWNRSGNNGLKTEVDKSEFYTEVSAYQHLFDEDSKKIDLQSFNRIGFESDGIHY